MPLSHDQPSAATNLRRRRLLLGFPWLKNREKTTGSPTPLAVSRWRWLDWTSRIRLPSTPYWWLVVGLGILGIAQQALFYSRYNPALTGQPAVLFPSRFVLPVMLVYMALSLRRLKNYTAVALGQLQSVVKLEAAEYAKHVRWTLQIPSWHLSLLFCINLGLDLYLYIVQKRPIPLGMEQKLPSDLPAAILVLGTFIVGGWLLFTLVYICVRFSLGLTRLSHQPLAVNVLDPYALLPFGRLALSYSITLVGLIMLLVVPLGMPGAFEDYLVVILPSLGSLWALIGPLWGVHRQIQRAKKAILERIHDQFRAIQETLLDGSPFEREELDDLSGRAEKLIKLRTLVWDAPNWPFRSSAGVVRAVLAALTPISLVVLQEIVKSVTSYWIRISPGP